MSPPRVGLLAVGTELFFPGRAETNTVWLAGELHRLGLPARWKAVAPDDLEVLVAALRHALELCELVLVTGGIGPTEDDLTREALARAVGRPLLRPEKLVRKVRKIQERIGVTPRETAMRQADLPEGAEALRNRKGTAPGVWLEDRDRVVALLPGVPGEMRGMWEDEIVPRLRGRFAPRPGASSLLRTTGLAESALANALDEASEAELPEGIVRTILAHPGSVDVIHAYTAAGVADEDARAGQEAVRRAHEAVRSLLAEHVYAEGDEELEEVVARLLLEREETLATAESCTGGLVSHRLTQVPGSSGVLLAGWVVYSNEAKVRDLGLPEEVLQEHGAVSEPVARHLATAAAERAGADWGIGITGIAGPSGGTEEKPVGTVHMAVARRGGEVVHDLRRFPGGRTEVKLRTSQWALDMLRRAASSLPSR